MWELVKNICRYVAALIDFVAYNVLEKVYDLFTELAQLSLYNERIMQILGKRIALVLGIFMLFRLAISLVTYLISPDKINDAGKGSKKLITNIIVSLVLLSTVNIIFKEAYVLQEKVVSSRIVEKVLFGNTYVGTQDPKLAYLVYGAFLQPNLKGCENIYYAYNNVSQECSIALNRQISEDIRRTIVDQIITQKNFGNVLKDYDTINATKTGTEEYVFDYTPIISTICAIIVILMILSFTLDLAVRIVKLLFFQIIAPIPIVSNMDPGKGAEIFKNWYKQCISTYVSVFIRIVAINFACFMIILLKTEFVEIFSGKSAFLTILLIIGCLMFAKQVPKLIEEIFGIKSDGMLLNPLKKFEEQALLGKNITGFAAGATVGTLGALPFVGRAGLTNGFRGAFNGLVGGKGFKEGWTNQRTQNQNMRSARAEGSSFFGRRRAQISGIAGTQTPSERIDAQVHAIDEKIKDIDNEMKPLNDSIDDRNSYTNKTKEMEDRAQQKIKNDEAGIISVQYKSMINRAEQLREQLRNGVAGITAQMVAEADQRAQDYLSKTGVYEYIDYSTGASDNITEYSENGVATGTILDRQHYANQINVSDGYMKSMNDDLVAMTKKPAEYEYIDSAGNKQKVRIDSTAVTMGAKNRHDHANVVSGSVNADKRTKVSKYNGEKQKLEQRKAKLYEKQRVASANKNAVGGK